jgi:hypothetical protein
MMYCSHHTQHFNVCRPALHVAVQRRILQKFNTFTNILHLYSLNEGRVNQNTKKTYTFSLLCTSKYRRNTQIGRVTINDVSFLIELVRMNETARGLMGPASRLRGHVAHFAKDEVP